MQVMISIQEGKISSAMLLRKLGHESTKNRLYRVFRELGRVIRTLYLLRYITDPQLRADITAGTNKVESYNRFVKWLVFGSEATITDLDPEEAEKAIKYGSVLANAVILHNAYDLTEAIKQLSDEGHAIVAEDLEFLSPYMTGHIKRFGDYMITEEAEPPSVESAIVWTLPPRKHPERAATRTHRASTRP